MKNCKNCNAEFQPKHETRGHEQLYCSIKCRLAAYKKRVNEKKEINKDDIIYDIMKLIEIINEFCIVEKIELNMKIRAQTIIYLIINKYKNQIK